MLASPSKDKLEHLAQGQVKFPMGVHCEARCFEKLLGYVDLEVLSTDGLCSIKEPAEQLASAVCQLEPASVEEIQTYQLMKDSKEEAKVEEFAALVRQFVVKLNQEPQEAVSEYLEQITADQDYLQAIFEALLEEQKVRVKGQVEDAFKTATKVQRALRLDLKRK